MITHGGHGEEAPSMQPGLAWLESLHAQTVATVTHQH